MYPSERIDDEVIKQTSAEIGIALDIVESVYKFQWKTANEATKLFNCVELTDLGVFKSAEKKREKKMITFEKIMERYLLNDNTLTGKKKETNQKKLETLKDSIEYLKSKSK